MNTFFNNPSFLQHERNLIQLHELIASGKGDSDEADQIRDRLDVTFSQLTSEERDRLDGVASDLFMLDGREEYQEHDVSERGQHRLSGALADAHRRNDWKSVLGLLRRGPSFVPPAQFAYIRGRAYEQLGHHAVARLFFRHASVLDPSNIAYPICELETLVRLGHHEEAAAYARAIAFDPRRPHQTRTLAVAAIRESLRDASTDNESRLSAELIPVLDDAIDAELSLGSRDSNDAVLICAYLLRAECRESVGEVDRAMSDWNDAIRKSEGVLKSTCLAGRGLLNLQLDRRDDALSDFELAVELECPHAFPYYFVATSHLLEERFPDVVRIARLGLEKAENRSLRAELHHVIAIALAYLGVSDKSVRREFDRARELDPFDELIRSNASRWESRSQLTPPQLNAQSDYGTIRQASEKLRERVLTSA